MQFGLSFIRYFNMFAVNCVQFNCVSLLIVTVTICSVTTQVWEVGSICPKGEVYYKGRCSTVHQILYDIFNSPSVNTNDSNDSDISSESTHSETSNVETTEVPVNTPEICGLGEDFVNGKCASFESSTETSIRFSNEFSNGWSNGFSTGLSTESSHQDGEHHQIDKSSSSSISAEDNWESQEVQSLTQNPLNLAIAAIFNVPASLPPRRTKMCPDKLVLSDGECKPYWI